MLSLGGGTFQVIAPSHTYVEEGTYSASVTIVHDAVPNAVVPLTITVSDLQLTNLLTNAPASGQEGAPVGPITGIANFNDPAGAPS